MTIILRRPFVTKRQKSDAKLYTQIADTYMTIANSFCKDNDGKFDDNGVQALQKSVTYMNKAARSLGFRNVADLYKYKETHGHI